MLFTSDKEDKIVSSKNGFIYFKKGKYETDNEDEIESLKNAVGVHSEDLDEIEDSNVNIDELILNIDLLKAKELKILANHFQFEYTNKDETVSKIKAILSESEN